MLKSYITKIVDEVINNKLTYCWNCKLVIRFKDIKRVFTDENKTHAYAYCPSCAPAYDKVIDGRYYKTDVEVTEDGKIKNK